MNDYFIVLLYFSIFYAIAVNFFHFYVKFFVAANVENVDEQEIIENSLKNSKLFLFTKRKNKILTFTVYWQLINTAKKVEITKITINNFDIFDSNKEENCIRIVRCRS